MSTKVYVGNLPLDIESRLVEDAFDKFGKIAQFALKRGFAFVHYEESSDAEKAVKEMDGMDFEGQRLRVEFATSTGDRRSRGEGGRGSGVASPNLFVALVPPEIHMSELRELFEAYGKVNNVKILPQSRGNETLSAFVDFEDIASAEKAHNAELVINGQKLRTDYNIRRRRDDPPRGGYGDRNDYGRGRSGDYDRRGGRDSGGYGRDRYDDRHDRRGGRDRSRSPEYRGRDRYSGSRHDDRYDDRGRDHRGGRSPPRRDYKNSDRGRGGGRSRSRSPPPRSDRSPPRGRSRSRD